MMLAGRYRLLSVMGRGAMGVVWAARNEAISRDIAIKVMHAKFAEDPVSLQRFFNEARICGSIRNPGIVDVLDLGRAEDGSPFLVMERLDGETLDARLELEGRLPPSVILPIVRDVARTIALAHEKDVIHRDLKPANLFIHRHPGGSEVVKVLDFGISKVITPGASMRATQTGAILGSPSYMSPEQALGEDTIDQRTDIYALGVILYEALAGRLPHQSHNCAALLVDVATKEPPPLAELVPGVPRPIATLVHAALAKDREKRIPSMVAFAERVELLLPGAAEADRLVSFAGRPARGSRSPAGTAVLSASVARPARSRRWLRAFAIAAGAAGVAVVVLVAATRSPGTPPPAPAAADTAPAAAVTPAPAAATVTPGAATTATPTPSTSGAAEAAAAPGATAAPKAPSTRQPGPAPTTKGNQGAWGYD